MNKSHAPHPSLPKGLFLSSQWPVVATRLGKAAIISSEDEQRVFPESEEKKSRTSRLTSLRIGYNKKRDTYYNYNCDKVGERKERYEKLAREVTHLGLMKKVEFQLLWEN